MSLYTGFNLLINLFQKIIGAPLSSRIYDYLETKSVQLQLDLFSLISALIRSTTDEDKTKAFDEIGKRATTILQNSIQNAIKSVLEAKCVSLNTRRALLERAVNVVEVRPVSLPIYWCT